MASEDTGGRVPTVYEWRAGFIQQEKRLETDVFVCAAGQCSLREGGVLFIIFNSLNSISAVSG